VEGYNESIFSFDHFKHTNINTMWIIQVNKAQVCACVDLADLCT